jgi:hypothetical protein
MKWQVSSKKKRGELIFTYNSMSELVYRIKKELKVRVLRVY